MEVKQLRETFESKLLQNVDQNIDIMQFISELTYHGAKQLADDYQQCKVFLYKSFDENSLGKWITKPFEQNHFMITNSISMKAENNDEMV